MPGALQPKGCSSLLAETVMCSGFSLKQHDSKQLIATWYLNQVEAHAVPLRNAVLPLAAATVTPRMPNECPADVYDETCTELLITANLDSGGRGRPRVTYDVTAALNAMHL